jgi:YesN/AraC family two-component response regulator
MIISDSKKKVRQELKNINWASICVSLQGSAANGIECMDLIKHYEPDVVLTDIKMSGLTGIEIARKARNEGIKTKFVIFTSYRRFDYAYQAIDLDIVSFVIKPSSENELLSAVKKAIDKIETEREIIKSREQLLRQVKEVNMDIINKFTHKTLNYNDEKITKLINYLENNYQDDITLASASKAVHVCPEYLCRLIKKETGSTFLKLLTCIRMNKATDLIQDRNVKIKSISSDVGFINSGYFSQTFKKYYGVTPAEFRKGIILNKEQG